MREIVELAKRVSVLEQAVERQMRPGTVHEVDAKKQRFRMRLNGDDGEPFLGPWIPYGQTAGALKFHNPPSVGQQMMMFAPAGEYRQATAYPMTFSDDNASPAEGGDEHVMTFGSVRLEIRGEQLKATVGGASLELTDGAITIKLGGSTLTITDDQIEAATAKMQVSGASLKHNAKEVGDTHRHRDVLPGPALTGVPN